jgi:hypothetical protein
MINSGQDYLCTDCEPYHWAFGPCKVHKCSWDKTVILFTNYIGVCNCGKEKVLTPDEINFKTQTAKSITEGS